MRFTGELFDTTSGLYHLRARTYDPRSGRFLQLEPLAPTLSTPHAGTYLHVQDRPTIASNPSGLWCLIHNSNEGCWGASVVEAGWDVARFVRNAPVTAASLALTEAGSIVTGNGLADCHLRTGLMIECVGAAPAALPGGAWTIGNTIISQFGQPIDADLLAHETKHADQWAILGPVGFVETWLVSSAVSGITTGTYPCGNFIEWWAGLDAGGYSRECSALGAASK